MGKYIDIHNMKRAAGNSMAKILFEDEYSEKDFIRLAGQKRDIQSPTVPRRNGNIHTAIY